MHALKSVLGVKRQPHRSSARRSAGWSRNTTCRSAERVALWALPRQLSAPARGRRRHTLSWRSDRRDRHIAPALRLPAHPRSAAPGVPGVNHKRVWRPYSAANLAVRKRKKVRRPTAERVPLQLASSVNEVWSMDFVSDSLANGRRPKCLTVADDFSHECVDIAVDHGISGQYVTTADQAAVFRATRQAVRTDNGRSSPAGPSSPGRSSITASAHPDRTGQAHAERLHRELQRQVPRRVPERALVPDLQQARRDHCALATRLQRGSTAQQHRAHPACAALPSSTAGMPAVLLTRIQPPTRSSRNLQPAGAVAEDAAHGFWPAGACCPLTSGCCMYIRLRTVRVIAVETEGFQTPHWRLHVLTVPVRPF